MIMKKYVLKFWYEFGGVCIWGENKAAKNKYGYAIGPEDLPLSKELVDKINQMQYEFATIIDWDDPRKPTEWTHEHLDDFLRRSNEIYEELKKELGSKYDVINEVGDVIAGFKYNKEHNQD